jgi:hypothetical protein
MSLTLEAPDWQEWSHGAIERKFGAGSVVLVPDSFPLSNQGLRDARDAPFISQLTGSAHHIWFDENHFGVVETGSVAKLMRQYRLEGAIAMLDRAPRSPAANRSKDSARCCIAASPKRICSTPASRNGPNPPSARIGRYASKRKSRESGNATRWKPIALRPEFYRRKND